MHVGFTKEGSKILSFGIIAISYDKKMVLSTLHSVIYFMLRMNQLFSEICLKSVPQHLFLFRIWAQIVSCPSQFWMSSCSVSKQMFWQIHISESLLCYSWFALLRFNWLAGKHNDFAQTSKGIRCWNTLLRKMSLNSSIISKDKYIKWLFFVFSAARLVIIWISSRYYFSKSTTYSNSTLLSSTFCGECEIVLYPWYFCPKIATPYWKLSSLGISPMVTVFKERSTFSRLQNQWQASIPRQLSMRNF